MLFRSPQTAAKRAREQAKRERREHKQAKKAARNAAASDAAWEIVETVELPPPSGGESAVAYLITLASVSANQEVVVEFATGSAAASSTAAEDATRPFLRNEQPPEHLVVEPTGTVTTRTERRTH